MKRDVVETLQVIAESMSEEEIAGLREMFKMIDTDNSGHITFEELKAGLERVGANLNESQIYNLMNAVSSNSNKNLSSSSCISTIRPMTYICLRQNAGRHRQQWDHRLRGVHSCNAASEQDREGRSSLQGLLLL